MIVYSHQAKFSPIPRCIKSLPVDTHCLHKTARLLGGSSGPCRFYVQVLLATLGRVITSPFLGESKKGSYSELCRKVVDFIGVRPI